MCFFLGRLGTHDLTRLDFCLGEPLMKGKKLISHFVCDIKSTKPLNIHQNESTGSLKKGTGDRCLDPNHVIGFLRIFASPHSKVHRKKPVTCGKKGWCCHHFQRGCVATTLSTTLPYDCHLVGFGGRGGVAVYAPENEHGTWKCLLETIIFTFHDKFLGGVSFDSFRSTSRWSNLPLLEGSKVLQFITCQF